MTWVEQMKRDAARIAFPDWDERDGDILDLLADYERDWSDITPGQGFSITVIIRRDGDQIHYRGYANKDAEEFFHKLMAAGAGPP